MSGTGTAYDAIGLCVLSTRSGTDLAYGFYRSAARCPVQIPISLCYLPMSLQCDVPYGHLMWFYLPMHLLHHLRYCLYTSTTRFSGTDLSWATILLRACYAMSATD
eukprot:2600904-Rhodomonas_salina.3